MVEVLVASAILITGMTGVITLMLKGATQNRDANVQLRASTITTSITARYASVDYNALSAGVTNETVTDEEGRAFPVTTTITEVGDGGVGAYRIEVKAAWVRGVNTGLAQPVDTVSVTYVSELPDAHFF